MTQTESYPNSPMSVLQEELKEDIEEDNNDNEQSPNSEVNAVDLFFAAQAMEVEPEIMSPRDVFNAFNVLLQNEPMPETNTVFERKPASASEIITRKLSPSRFTRIMRSAPYSYDIDALIDELQDDDGMIPLDQIAHYDLHSEDEMVDCD